jgi:hypothetical protein
MRDELTEYLKIGTIHGVSSRKLFMLKMKTETRKGLLLVQLGPFLACGMVITSLAPIVFTNQCMCKDWHC